MLSVAFLEANQLDTTTRMKTQSAYAGVTRLGVHLARVAHRDLNGGAEWGERAG